MKRTIKVVLIYFAVIALGWVELSWGAQVQGDKPSLLAGEAAAPDAAAVTDTPTVTDTVVEPPARRYSVAAVPMHEPNWSPIVIPRGEYRDHIKSMPIEERPYRPLHFYGNTIRRSHYRGNPLPMPRDLSKTATELIRRR